LRRIHEEVPGILRLRFVTSFPMHFPDEALQAMRDCPRICRYLHVPAQSGSNRILKLMNRGYTIENYLEFIDRARTMLPDVSIAGDIIVGFPTETDADFEMTRDLLRRVPFKNNFIFKYSPRPGTVAIERYADDVPEDLKRRRNNELLALQNEVSARVHASWVGREVDVLVERVSRQARAPGHVAGLGTERVNSFAVEVRWDIASSHRDARANAWRASPQLSGRTPGDLIAVFDAPPGESAQSLVGRIVRVRVTGSGPLILHTALIAGRASSGLSTTPTVQVP
jgi:tRNA-2-methylthio-N6-dimethylallyladenosine synthase